MKLPAKVLFLSVPIVFGVSFIPFYIMYKTQGLSLRCFGASSPVSLNLINNSDATQKLTLFEYQDGNGFEKITKINVDAWAFKTICLDVESPLSNGLYVFNGEKTYKMKLGGPGDKNLYLNDSTHLQPTPALLKELSKSFW